MDTEAIKNIIGEFIKQLGVSFDEIAISHGKAEEKVEGKVEDCPIFSIKTADSGVLIGSRGANLGALNHIIKKIASKRLSLPEDARFVVDVNNYHEKMVEDLKTRAHIMSERARSFGVDVPLPPMTSYERMIIHSFLENASGIKTESEGEGKNRRVIIKYVKEN